MELNESVPDFGDGGDISVGGGVVVSLVDTRGLSPAQSSVAFMTASLYFRYWSPSSSSSSSSSSSEQESVSSDSSPSFCISCETSRRISRVSSFGNDRPVLVSLTG